MSNPCPNPHEPGAKLDHDKPRCSLVLGAFAPALIEVAKVGTYGAKKYTEHGWKLVPNGIERYKDALYRHLLAEELIDPDSGLPHMAHVAWNALAVLTLQIWGGWYR